MDKVKNVSDIAREKEKGNINVPVFIIFAKCKLNENETDLLHEIRCWACIDNLDVGNLEPVNKELYLQV